jgi:deoxyribonuclease-1
LGSGYGMDQKTSWGAWMRLLSYKLLLFILTSAAPAFALEAYYGEEIAAKQGQLDQVNLKSLLFQVLSRVHITRDGLPDQLSNQCPAEKRCFSHRMLGYSGARKVLFGRLFLVKEGADYAVDDVYCNKRFTEEDFPRGQGPGPDRIPSNVVVNAEHAWPQSHFSRRFPKEMQKSDLHILFSTSSSANSLRGNLPFGDVVTVSRQVCPASAQGYPSRGNDVSFLPPPEIRGDIARALFYFSVRYQMTIGPNEEETLKNWSQQDPIDTAERSRHEEKFRAMQIRNPFIDHPEWVDMIRDY